MHKIKLVYPIPGKDIENSELLKSINEWMPKSFIQLPDNYFYGAIAGKMPRPNLLLYCGCVKGFDSRTLEFEIESSNTEHGKILDQMLNISVEMGIILVIDQSKILEAIVNPNFSASPLNHRHPDSVLDILQ